METIIVQVKNKIAENITPDIKIVCGNDGYKVKFDLDSEWEFSNLKTALLIFNGKCMPIPFEGDSLSIPPIKKATLLGIGLKSTDIDGLHTTTAANVVCVFSASDLVCQEIEEPEKDVYDRIIELLNKYISGGGISQETDPTVPAWAKQPKKPTYTAQEVGALSQGELQSGVNQALQQAKESGEFDGENGKDYVLTETDKKEIAEEAAKLVEVPSVTPRIEMSSSDTAVTIEPNKYYVFPEMESLDITFGGAIDTSIVQEYKFRFTSGATATTFTLPSDVKGEIIVNANSVVEVSIVDGYAVSQSWAVE